MISLKKVCKEPKKVLPLHTDKYNCTNMKKLPLATRVLGGALSVLNTITTSHRVWQLVATSVDSSRLVLVRRVCSAPVCVISSKISY